ncbi:molybdopterin-guanine dinucleotide biosynthesis protein A [Hymenobacter luteus]|uniref:Probable molybdenum cofactor guanylyltransferase n=2 Tax=Hymenobacter TaxID=89966 RepID=A0A7W9SYK8_9BACT|nr:MULTISPECIES: NTP transferase domain-containing protein [Hymenobacter]MBB4599554.1 molybdopterin-guanine dinucleotide biosynthesis protein A [Hymenobacter latericoloratus]MBB6058136.1 molybdopterin-guanine dinucleotide biosynthesis protein A [Hymenobacter luteus]
MSDKPTADSASPTPAPRTKHAQLARPDLGEFGRHELAILGAPCGKIKELAARLLPLLAPTLRVAYVDADHAAGDDAAQGGSGGQDAVLQAGAAAELTDKITFTRLDVKRGFDKFSQQEWLQHQSLVLVNGNHFRARQQLVILDSAKPVEKKLDRLTNVRALLLPEGVTEVPAYLRAHLAEANVPVLPLHDTETLADLILREWHQAAPPLRGLVLAGGRSQRMGQDKGKLAYHQGREQRAYAAELLAGFCQDVHVSCRPDQVMELEYAGLRPLPDTFADLGPLSGLLSAFRLDPNAAWLVVACDLPFLSETTLGHLVEHRQPARLATAYQSPENEWPEPLITIWEPGSYATLLRFLSLGYSCPRKSLINSDIELLPPPAPQELRNVNTPEQAEQARQELKG